MDSRDNGDELNFMSAIEAHIRWKVRLEAYIDGSGEEELNAAEAACDDKCVLGRWIYGAGGERHASHPKFENLKAIHARFHQAAGAVISAVDAGDPDGARDLLYRGEYSTSSQRIKAELARLALELER